MRLVFTEAADADLLDLFLEGMERHGLAQAERYRERLRQSFALLALNPPRPALGDGTRTLVIGVHVAIYEIGADELRVLNVRHQREDWL